VTGEILWKALHIARDCHTLQSDVSYNAGVEAEAYAAWINGTALLEKQSDWDSALGALVRAKCGSATPSQCSRHVWKISIAADIA
jgi:hypothetical protein